MMSDDQIEEKRRSTAIIAFKILHDTTLSLRPLTAERTTHFRNTPSKCNLPNRPTRWPSLHQKSAKWIVETHTCAKLTRVLEPFLETRVEPRQQHGRLALLGLDTGRLGPSGAQGLQCVRRA